MHKKLVLRIDEEFGVVLQDKTHRELLNFFSCVLLDV